jgi:transcriptional regulator
MHPNSAFRQTPTDRNLDFARARGFGALCVNGVDGPVLAHVPFLLSPDGRFADLHLARSNAVIAAGLPAKAVLAVSGPDGYVSPDWYGVEDQVPTWNYIAVHLRGTLTELPPEALEGHVNALSDAFEALLAPKPIWKSTKMTEGVMARMMRMIRPFRLEIATVDGTWKLNQNKTEAARDGVIRALMAKGDTSAALALAMRDGQAT